VPFPPPVPPWQRVALTPCSQSSGPARQSQVPCANLDCGITDEIDEETYFGDTMTGNNGSCIRFGSINLNNMLQTSEGDERLFREIYRRGIQALALQEVGCNWSIMGRHQALQQRLNDTFGPYDTRAIVRHNVHDLTGTSRQWGGTGIILKGKIKHYNKGSGGDPTGLGRWTWIRLQGKGGVVFRYVSIYCPCKNKDGVLTVWSQHKVYLQSNNDDRDPCDAFLEDLRTHIEQWVKEGDQILIGGDLNHQVLSRKVIELFGEFHMKNLIFERHSTHNAPSTYYLHEEGRIVDGLWGTPGLVATRCGYLRPETFPGNHSLLWADISYQSALGHIPPRPNTPAARRLQLSIPSCVDRYLQSYTTQIQILDLPKRQFYLESTTKPNHPLSPSQKQEAEAIDYLKTGCMNRAEKHCRKLRMGEVGFSEATMLPLRRIIWWNIAIRRRQGGRVQPSLWQRRKREAGMRDLRTSTLSLAEMQTLRRQAVKDYRTAKRQHVDHRQQHLMKLPKKIRKRLRKVEEQRRLGKMAKSVTGKLASKSIIMVEHEGKEYFTKEEIEEVLLQVNENKVRASEETPFMQDPLTRDFGYGIESQEHDRVLEGTYIAPPECDQATALLIQGLKKPESFYTMQEALPRTRITTADHVKGWKKQKERTAGGLSGLHFGHYKAHIRVPLLADFDASMRSVAYTTGYSYKRWQKGVDVQLMKKSGDHRATGLRTILLIEPDHNMNNKMLGKDTMRMGEKMTELARDNYGGRKGLRAVEVSMNQLLTFNSIWARRGRAIIMSNDAKGCYDRIAHTVVNLALQRLGAPRPALQSMITTIQAMEHYVQTSFGVSSKAYNIDRSRPPVQGILQGNGAGPAGWSAIAAVIINAMKKQGFGHSSWSLIRRRALTLVCFAFVDDTDIIHSHPDRSIPTSQVIEQAQKALTLWENLLRATGGALVPEKSY
jgi:exonuclease III